jgi:alanine dehydrogenase
MRIGIPRERKSFEGRVGLVPEACIGLTAQGHRVFVEAGAGEKSGFDDEDYRAAGASVLGDPEKVYEIAQLVVKVKEPVAEDLRCLRSDHLLFCFLHLAASPELAEALCRIGLTALAFETVEEGGRLPILAPMSEIAGRLAAQIGAHLLHQPQGGSGVLLGGVPAAGRGRVVIVGAGAAGGGAAAMAAAMGAEVTVFDKRYERLLAMRALGHHVTALYPFEEEIRRAVVAADLVIGAVLVTGRRAPRVVDAATVANMRPGSVLIDVSVDQGGCFETTRPTSFDQPTYVVNGVTHFAVTNMPGAVPRSAAPALSAALIPFVARLAGEDWQHFPPLRAGINVAQGRLAHPALQAS